MMATRSAFIAILLLSIAVPTAAGAALSEYQVKAALIYNLAKFVEWPTSALPDSQPSIVLCILGQDPFGANLQQTIAGKMVHGRALEMRRIREIGAAQGCHILFISSSERSRLPQILDAFQKRPVVTIGEMDQFAQLGGMVNLIIEENRVQFEINIDTAERAGLTISSRALKLARIVRSGGA
jgi:hypothetical protein